MSDLHLEATCLEVEELPCDVVVLAGDIDQVVNGSVAQWARASFPGNEIVWILGNHEHYYWNGADGIEGCLVRARELAQESDLHLLENESTVINGVRILGCTLWTDFDLQSTPTESMAYARRLMNDFTGHILVTEEGGQNHRLFRDFQPEESVRIHRASVKWLASELASPFQGKTVVVTHHAPHTRCEHSSHVGGKLSPAFCSDLGELIEAYQPDLWISGHTHASHDFRIGRTRLVSNQRGYRDLPEHPDAPFDPGLVVEV